MAIDDYSDEVTREVESRLDDLFGEFESVQEEEEKHERQEVQELPELQELEAIEEPQEPRATAPVEAEADEMPEPEPLKPDLLQEDLSQDEVPIEGVNNTIDQLKAAFYSIDWEITEASMHTFFCQIVDLKKSYDQEPVIYQNLRLLGAVGKYIRRKKAKAHPDSFGLFKSLFNCFEHSVSKSVDPRDIKKRFKKEVVRFKKLREEILKLQGPIVSSLPQDKIEKAAPLDDPLIKIGDDNLIQKTDDDKAKEVPKLPATAEEMQALEASFEDVKDFIRSELFKLKEDIIQRVLAEKGIR